MSIISSERKAKLSCVEKLLDHFELELMNNSYTNHIISERFNFSEFLFLYPFFVIVIDASAF